MRALGPRPDTDVSPAGRPRAYGLDLGGHCPSGSAVLDTDGVLYLVRTDDGGELDLLAIQTRSLGLANSSWPSLRHDNRGTSWLVP